MGLLKMTPEEIAAIPFHLEEGADEPVPCNDLEHCALSPHARGFEEAAKLVARRESAKLWIWPAFTKADMPILAESERTGKTILELRKEGW